ncbi:hypothetical protein RchiOBHm_Chr4g0400641 [Rosa chinensis]|uniref:Uncharacterized protein n=1 Tax=Rosa chinensis TaxID=74649 RepID=A0A2P6QSW2_ROSCH|nr:hypothetical protein RchiOBHm_Chr4g0400641 [Rosa chinensis]
MVVLHFIWVYIVLGFFLYYWIDFSGTQAGLFPTFFCFSMFGSTIKVNSGLQMMVAFSSLFSSFIVERVGERIGLSCLFALLFIALLSTAYES